MELIDKTAVIAEIEKLVDKRKYHDEYDYAYRDGNNGALYALKEKIDTLEVKEEKESTASDRGMTEEIIFQLKRVEQDYFIDLTREMEWLRNIVKEENKL